MAMNVMSADWRTLGGACAAAALLAATLSASPLGAASQGPEQRPGEGPAASAPVALLAPATAAERVLDPDPHGAVVIRSRPVLIRPEALPSPTARSIPATVELNLFDDVRLEAVIDYIAPGDPGTPGSHVLVGRLAGDEESWVYLAVCGEALIGDVLTPKTGLGYQIRYIADGVHEAREIVDQGADACGVGPEHHIRFEPRVDDALPAAEGPDEDGGAPGAQRDGVPQTGPVIDVLIAYTVGARNQAGGTDAIRASLANWIAQTNTAYANSLMKQTVRAVLLVETNFVETDSASTDLALLRGTNDGNMDNLHDLRDEFGADLVHLASRSVGVCGIAYVMATVSPDFRTNGFGVTVYSCGALTFAHELGHNMGCTHDHQNGGAAAYCYSFGHRTPNNQYRTIMSYAPGTRVPYFSNPTVSFAGHVLGVTGIGCPSDAADNAQSMNNTATTVASFRPQIFEADPPESFGLIGPLPGAVGVSTQATLMWQGAPNSTGYLVVVSAFDDLTEPIYSQFRNGFSVTLPGGLLAFDTQYYWGVTAVGHGGQTPGTPAVASFRTRKLADLNGDGVVNSTDLAVMLGVWGPTPTNADLNGDGRADSQDLALMLGEWG